MTTVKLCLRLETTHAVLDNAQDMISIKALAVKVIPFQSNF